MQGIRLWPPYPRGTQWYSSWSRPVVLKLQHASELPGGLIKTQIAGTCPRVSDAVHLGSGQRSYIYNKCPSDAVAAGQGTTFWESVPWNFLNGHTQEFVPKGLCCQPGLSHPFSAHCTVAAFPELVLSTAGNPWGISAPVHRPPTGWACCWTWPSVGIVWCPEMSLGHTPAQWVTAFPAPAEWVQPKQLGSILLRWPGISVPLPLELCPQSLYQSLGPGVLLPSPFRQRLDKAPSGWEALCLSNLMGCSHTHAHLLSRWAIPRNNFFNTGSIIIKMATEILMFVMLLKSSKLKIGNTSPRAVPAWHPNYLYFPLAELSPRLPQNLLPPTAPPSLAASWLWYLLFPFSGFCKTARVPWTLH